eukprot:6207611-Prymnesium_polylepis.1
MVGEVGVDRLCVKGAAAVDDEADGVWWLFVYGVLRAGWAGGVGVDKRYRVEERWSGRWVAVGGEVEGSEGATMGGGGGGRDGAACG